MPRPRIPAHVGDASCTECGGDYYARGLCRRFYTARRTAGDLTPPCSIEGCGKATHTRGLCPMHYRRLRLYGDPSATRRHGPPIGYVVSPLADRFRAKVDRRSPDECWLWVGSVALAG